MSNKRYTWLIVFIVGALASAPVGIGVFFASNQAFSTLALSEQYAAATSDVGWRIFRLGATASRRAMV